MASPFCTPKATCSELYHFPTIGKSHRLLGEKHSIALLAQDLRLKIWIRQEMLELP